MKKRILPVLLVLCSLPLMAQQETVQAPQVTPLPQDTALYYGKLENGLTYYVRRNTFIPGRASFYIAQNVGSILEEPSQRGLAHFLEHMAFNGTVHYPGKGIIDYLETIGVKFGANLNAYTGVDETVYNIKDVPVERISTADSCLLILRDWSDGILLEPDEIDKERAVIEEEWRTRNNGYQRMAEEAARQIYAGGKYADAFPIGSMDVVRNFKYSTLRNYYRKWYRPDLQAVIVVGDIDPVRTVEKIKELFADRKMPKKAAERIWYPVSDNAAPIIVSTTDNELSVANLLLFQKQDVVPFAMRASVENFAEEYRRALVAMMVNSRLSEIAQSPNPPFVGANYGISPFFISKTKDAESYEFYFAPSRFEENLVRLLTERERVKRYGFTQGELQRAKDELLMSYAKLFNERENQNNEYFVQKYVGNFTSGNPAASIETCYQLAQAFSQVMTLDFVNASCVSDNDSNMVVWLMSPDNAKELMPSKERVEFLIDSVAGAQIEPYRDDFERKELISDLPAAGSIASTEKLPYGITKYVLSNGAEVYVKPTDFKSDEILLHVEGKGGMSLENEGDAVTMNFLDDFASLGGLGEFSAVELQKQLSGKRLDMGASVDVYFQLVGGSSDVESFENLMQLLYLQFTSVREDSAAYQAYMDRIAGVFKNIEQLPAVTLADSVIAAVYDNHPFAKRLRYEDLPQVDYKKGLEILRRRFGNAAAMDFVIVGNVDTTSLKPLLCRYVASLPASDTVEVWQNCGFAPVPGERYVRYGKTMQDPKTSVSITYSGELPYTLKNIVALNVFENILDIVYTATVREEEGGTYGVSTSSSLEKEPTEHFEFKIKFDSDSAKVDRLLPIIGNEIKRMAEEGPSAGNLQKVKEYLAKVYTDNQEQNGYWLNVINQFVQNGVDMQSAYMATLESIDATAIKEMAKTVYECGNYKEVVQIGTAAVSRQ